MERCPDRPRVDRLPALGGAARLRPGAGRPGPPGRDAASVPAEAARKRYRDAAELITPVQASATARPFINSAFDALYLVCALHEIQDRDAPLAEFRRVPRPGGLLAVVEFRPDPDYRLRGTTRRVVESRWFSHEVTGGLLWSYTARFR